MSESHLTFRFVRLPADRNLHRVVLGIYEKASLLQGLDNSDPGMEPFRTLYTVETYPRRKI